MARKRLLPVVLFCVLTIVPLEAATVSFLVMETGLPAGGSAGPYSLMWENGLLDVFFEQGHIVSNAPILRVFETPEAGFPADAEMERQAAKEGGVDFFIIAIVDYPPPRDQEILKPQNVSLRLFNIKSGKMIYERQYADKISKTQKEELDNLKKVVVSLIPYLKVQ